MPAPIGIFDSGYGGLTVMKEILRELPAYNYIYLGDNARAPYGPRSFDTVYRYTLQAVEWFFEQGCPLIILACNTASAKALRTIQQRDLPQMKDPTRRVLGVIRPTAEVLGAYSKSREVGVLGTAGTVSSNSYPIEIQKFFPDIRVFQQACPMWVPLVENRAYESPGADYFVQECLDKLLAQSPRIDTILLACTHYPLLISKIRTYLDKREHRIPDFPPESVPSGETGGDLPGSRIEILSQGEIVARSLKDYLHRHPEMEQRIGRNSELRIPDSGLPEATPGLGQHGQPPGHLGHPPGEFPPMEGSRRFFTTDSTGDFDRQATIFLGRHLRSEHVVL